MTAARRARRDRRPGGAPAPASSSCGVGCVAWPTTPFGERTASDRHCV